MIKLEIEVLVGNKPVTGPFSAGQKKRSRRTRNITKHLKQFVTTSTLRKNYGIRTATLVDEMKRENFGTFNRLLAKFERRFPDNLPVLSTV